jgi:hypothetical protein
MPATLPEPTDDELREAWRALARPGWGSFDAARAAALRWMLVRSRARIIAHGTRIAPAPDAQAKAAPDTQPAQPGPHAWGSLRIPQHPPQFDRKRAAAGEREDDCT